ncbi:hypothetical protein [Paraburkholderia flava]|uniref:hypothetical protein n=1 Tax=Paraburkholderia flava TaxID=2547393 RepID=UPI00105D6961|nr:hypothetical protein [Paraburkholderia flava]
MLDIGSGSLLDLFSTDWMDATRLDATRRISIAASNSGGNAFDRLHVRRDDTSIATIARRPKKHFVAPLAPQSSHQSTLPQRPWRQTS